jgi:hypothetical protein
MRTAFTNTKIAMLIACVASLIACTSNKSINKDEWAVVAKKNGDLTVANLSLFDAENKPE